MTDRRPQHTADLVRVVHSEGRRYARVIDDDGNTVAKVSRQHFDVIPGDDLGMRANADRLADCWNAMEPVANPQEFVATVRHAVNASVNGDGTALVEILDRLGEMLDE